MDKGLLIAVQSPWLIVLSDVGAHCTQDVLLNVVYKDDDSKIASLLNNKNM